jgi:hypothetical protein
VNHGSLSESEIKHKKGLVLRELKSLKSEISETHFHLSDDFMQGPKILNAREGTGYCGERERAVQRRTLSLRL